MSKSLANEYLKKSNKVKTNVIFDNGTKYKLEIEGEYKEMSNQTTLKSLEKLIIDLSTRVEKGFDNVENRLDNIENRLDVVEKDIKDMKNTPTMLKELRK